MSWNLLSTTCSNEGSGRWRKEEEERFVYDFPMFVANQVWK